MDNMHGYIFAVLLFGYFRVHVHVHVHLFLDLLFYCYFFECLYLYVVCVCIHMYICICMCVLMVASGLPWGEWVDRYSTTSAGMLKTMWAGSATLC